MSCTKELAEILRVRGFRMTPQRHGIIHALKASKGHLSPLQVFELVRQDLPGITETTVYRTLEFLAENSVVQPALNGDRHLVYEIAAHDHHHVFCSACGASLEVDHELLRPLYQQLEATSGFHFTSNHLTFFGICPACQANS